MSSTSPQSTYSIDQQMMTLSALAYTDYNNINSIYTDLKQELTDTGYATQGEWVLDWGPSYHNSADLQSSLVCYAVLNTTTQERAIVFRGTIPADFIDMLDDLEVLEAKTWPYGNPPSDAVIASGSLQALQTVLKEESNYVDSGVTLSDYIDNLSINGNTDLYLTGHSLGGATATSMSLYIENNYSNFNLNTYTFAAPTVGNDSFASYYESIIPTNLHRYYWYWDLMPNFWQTLSETLGKSIPVETKGLEMDTFLNALIALGTVPGIAWTQTSAGIELPGKRIIPPNAVTPARSVVPEYADWVGAQHSHDTYLALLNTPPVNVIYKHA